MSIFSVCVFRIGAPPTETIPCQAFPGASTRVGVCFHSGGRPSLLHQALVSFSSLQTELLDVVGDQLKAAVVLQPFQKLLRWNLSRPRWVRSGGAVVSGPSRRQQSPTELQLLTRDIKVSS